MPTDDITIVPAGSRLYERPVRTVPVYFVTSEDPTVTKGVKHFLAVKMDEMSTYVRIAGFEINKDVNKICENYQELLNLTDKSLYKEYLVPWHRVIKIQNLIFRQK